MEILLGSIVIIGGSVGICKLADYTSKKIPSLYDEIKRKSLKRKLIKCCKNGNHLKFKESIDKLIGIRKLSDYYDIMDEMPIEYILNQTLEEINDKIPSEMWGYAYRDEIYFSKVRYYLCNALTITETEETCCICLDSICNFGYTKTNCGHYFHTHCLTQWKHHNNTCPLCRAGI